MQVFFFFDAKKYLCLVFNLIFFTYDLILVPSNFPKCILPPRMWVLSAGQTSCSPCEEDQVLLCLTLLLPPVTTWFLSVKNN